MPPSEFKENAEDLNTGDSVQVVNLPMTNGQLEGIGRRTAARDGSDHYTYEIDGIGYDGHWANDIAGLLAEVESRGRAVEALSARLTAKNAELDKVIREAATNKAKLAAVRVEPPELAAIRERVDRDFVTDPGSVSGELAAELMQARIDRRALLVNFDAELAEHAKPAPEMPRPPAEEADALAKHEAAIAEYVRACKADGCSCYPIASNTKVISHWCRIHGVLSIFPAELTWTNPGIRGGEPCMRGTRVPVEQVCTLLEDGATWEFVKETYPSIPTPEGHREATQPGADGTDTSPAGSGRGTGVTESPGAAQVGDAWREFSRVIDEEEPDDILAAALDIPGLWADENQPEAPAEAEHIGAVRGAYRPEHASVLLRLIADAETTTPYYRRPVIVQDGAITDAGFLRDAVVAIWGAVPDLLPSLPVPSTADYRHEPEGATDV